MPLEHLINTYGYIAILIGTFLEGETILVLGGVTAKLGYLELQWVIVCAFAGTLFGDQLFFFTGRYHGTAVLRRHPSWHRRVEKVDKILQRHRILIILGFRFLYGLRTVTLFVIGMSHVPVIEFVVLNILGAAIWSIAIGSLGYAFGHGLELILGDIRHYEMEALTAVLLIGILIWLIYIVRLKKNKPVNIGRE